MEIPILNNVRLGLTKKVTLSRLEKGEVIQMSRGRTFKQGIASAKFLRQECAWQG